MLLEIKEDIKRNSSPISKIVCINYRLRRYIYLFKVPIIKQVLSVIGTLIGLVVRVISQSEVSPKSNIGKGLRLEHGANGIMIHNDAIIGENAKIFQQVTIGVNIGKNGRCPRIGDNVLIGAGAKVVGDINIGNNVKIGTNSVVLIDIPDNCTAVGVPARIIYSSPK